MVSGGSLTGGGFYLDFTRGEQQIIATLGGATLGAAICLIPGIGTAACRFITPALAAAYSFLGSNTPCNTLRINVKPFRPPAVGVATVPLCFR